MIDFPVIASYPRAGSHLLAALVLERLGVEDAPWPGDMRTKAGRDRLRREFVPFVKCGEIHHGPPRHGFVTTHGAPDIFTGPKVVLVRQPEALAASWASYFGMPIEQARAEIKGGSNNKPWLGPPSDVGGFLAAWAMAGAMVVSYENLIDWPAPVVVASVISHLGLKPCGTDSDH